MFYWKGSTINILRKLKAKGLKQGTLVHSLPSMWFSGRLGIQEEGRVPFHEVDGQLLVEVAGGH